MGKNKIKAITAEVGGTLSVSELSQIPREYVTRRPRDADDSLWQNLYGAPANQTSPEALRAHRARRAAEAAAAAAPLGMTEVTLPPEVAQ